MAKTKLFPYILVAAALAGCGDEVPTPSEDKPGAAQAAPFGCTEEGVKPYKSEYLSIMDEIEVCNAILASDGKLPSPNLFQQLSKAVVAFQLKGSKDDARELSYQLMNVVEARGQSNADDATKAKTFDLVFRMYNGWNGRITPNDVNVFLRNSGEAGQKLSDDGLTQMMAMVLEEKKAAGQ